ncbi:hypothetical protein [Helicobacter sp. MIT 99-5507]|uniref:hypothetical protein n=1 Tax=Helicobacter sp. MIT 99-5507 TaxID=152489 RepID=UPI000E1FADD1|nr:hypothetical protein [Helicobacter sp. MIT 99-5507]RDU57529.1 hypothetical protein CQA42_06320 [Helicobacter sp. MIT 99-5507]
MRKRLVFIIFFIISASGVFVFIANEYTKRLEKNAIEAYMQSIQNELKEYSLDMIASDVECRGFIKHTCKINNARIYNNLEIDLTDITLSIKNISYNNISVLINIGKISHNNYNPFLSLLPNKFQYTLNLHKVDSKLGFVMLKRSVYFNFDSFDMNANLDLLLREKKNSNKSIFYILKEWFDNTTPSFYEYSIDNLAMRLNAKDGNYKNNKLIINILKTLTNKIDKKQLNNNKLALKYLDELINSADKIIDKKANEVTLNVRRKNPDISFFNLLNKEAATKKSLEIIEIINSINETYNINLQTK